MKSSIITPYLLNPTDASPKNKNYIRAVLKHATVNTSITKLNAMQASDEQPLSWGMVKSEITKENSCDVHCQSLGANSAIGIFPKLEPVRFQAQFDAKEIIPIVSYIRQNKSNAKSYLISKKQTTKIEMLYLLRNLQDFLTISGGLHLLLQGQDVIFFQVIDVDVNGKINCKHFSIHHSGKHNMTKLQLMPTLKFDFNDGLHLDHSGDGSNITFFGKRDSGNFKKWVESCSIKSDFRNKFIDLNNTPESLQTLIDTEFDFAEEISIKIVFELQKIFCNWQEKDYQNEFAQYCQPIFPLQLMNISVELLIPRQDERKTLYLYVRHSAHDEQLDLTDLKNQLLKKTGKIDFNGKVWRFKLGDAVHEFDCANPLLIDRTYLKDNFLKIRLDTSKTLTTTSGLIPLVDTSTTSASSVSTSSIFQSDWNDLTAHFRHYFTRCTKKLLRSKQQPKEFWDALQQKEKDSFLADFQDFSSVREEIMAGLESIKELKLEVQKTQTQAVLFVLGSQQKLLQLDSFSVKMLRDEIMELVSDPYTRPKEDPSDWNESGPFKFMLACCDKKTGAVLECNAEKSEKYIELITFFNSVIKDLKSARNKLT